MLVSYSKGIHKWFGTISHPWANCQWRVDLHGTHMRGFLCLVEGLHSPWPSRCCAKLHKWYQQLGDPRFWDWTIIAVCVRFIWILCFATAGQKPLQTRPGKNLLLSSCVAVAWAADVPLQWCLAVHIFCFTYLLIGTNVIKCIHKNIYV